MTTNLYESPAEMLLAVHEEKSRVYGSSWCKRGELFSILPNIGRKVDRLGHAGAGDTELDTRLDLLAYLSLYVGWLWRNRLTRGDLVPLLVRSPDLTDGIWELLSPLEYEQKSVDEVLHRCQTQIPRENSRTTDEQLVRRINFSFDRLCHEMEEKDTDYLLCLEIINHLVRRSWELFRREWMRARSERLTWNPEA